MSSRNKTIYWMLVRDGRLFQENLHREWLRPETVQFELRLNGEEHPREVREARLEPSGQVSVLKAMGSTPVPKKDERLLR